MTLKKPNGRPYRIVLTGGPGGGKTTAGDIFRREYRDEVVLVPEAATILFSGGFPRRTQPDAVRATQKAIYHLQRSLEDLYTCTSPQTVLLCDRGTLDGAAYWPEGPQDFYETFEMDLQQELSRYDAVLFFESAAVGGNSIEGGNPIRTEDLEQAAQLDRKLRDIWSIHPFFQVIPHSASFFDKIKDALRLLHELLKDQLNIPPRVIASFLDQDSSPKS
ncbi:MAG: AAA family ATPase [Myxococcales bacterium]|nr:AAA family ATPase [Myxococcales bacterium]